MLKKFKIISKIVEWVVFAFLMCFLFILFSPKLPIKNVPKSFVVITGSMEPTIKTGSVAFVKEVDVKSIKVGDIIAFTSPSDPNDTILHRVASVSSTTPLQFKTKGDNNNDIDAWDVMGAGVKGVYITAIPYLGLIAAFIKKPLGFALVVGIPALIFIIFQLFNIKKAIAEEVDRKVSQKISEVKKTDSTKTILKSIIFFAIFLSTLFSLSSIHTIKALFSDTVTISGINFSIADFAKPSAPILISPANNIFRSTKDLVMDWSDVINHQNPNNVFYIYQSSRLPDFSSTAGYRDHLLVSQVPAPGTSNGIYYWRVKACFTVDNCSDWSEVWKITVDSTLPESVITKPMLNWEYNNDVYTIKTFLEYWGGEIKGTATDNLSGIDHVELSIHYIGKNIFKDLNKFWDNNTKDWVIGNELTSRVGATGTTDWKYTIDPTKLDYGIYKIVSHAVDKAGNIENSATIIFEYADPNEEASASTEINVSSNHSTNKINLEVTNISSPLTYEILYIGNGVEKGISGHITADEIINSKYSNDFYFGTCTTGGTCTPEKIEIGSTIIVNLTGDQTITKNFTY